MSCTFSLYFWRIAGLGLKVCGQVMGLQQLLQVRIWEQRSGKEAKTSSE